jgi:hypothetical protein
MNSHRNLMIQKMRRIYPQTLHDALHAVRGMQEQVDALLGDPNVTVGTASVPAKPALPTRTATENTPAPVKEIKKTDLRKKRESLELQLRQVLSDADAWLDQQVIDAIEAKLATFKKPATSVQTAGAAEMIAKLRRKAVASE